MLGGLTEAGYHLVDDPEAEVILVNTCAFIGEAKQESVNAILALGRAQEVRPLPHADRHRLPDPALRHRARRRDARGGPLPGHRRLRPGRRPAGGAEAAPRSIVPTPSTSTPPHAAHQLAPSYKAFLKISEGCDNACAFCIIPKLRGGQRSRPIADVVAEAQRARCGEARSS